MHCYLFSIQFRGTDALNVKKRYDKKNLKNDNKKQLSVNRWLEPVTTIVCYIESFSLKVPHKCSTSVHHVSNSNENC